MWNHNIKLAFRNLLRHKTFSFINILGLTVGLASFFFFFFFFYFLSFFFKKKNKKYILKKKKNKKNKLAQQDGITPGQLTPALVKVVHE